MASKQRGNTLVTIVLLLLVLTGVFLIVAGYSVADVASYNRVVQAAQSNPEASAKVEAYLLAHPTPTYLELSQLKTEVDGLVLRDMSRRLTGNDNSQTEAEQRRQAEDAENARIAQRLAAIDSKPLTSMSFDEFVSWCAGQTKWAIVIAAVPITISLMFSFLRSMRNPYR